MGLEAKKLGLRTTRRFHAQRPAAQICDEHLQADLDDQGPLWSWRAAATSSPSNGSHRRRLSIYCPRETGPARPGGSAPFKTALQRNFAAILAESSRSTNLPGLKARCAAWASGTPKTRSAVMTGRAKRGSTRADLATRPRR